MRRRLLLAAASIVLLAVPTLAQAPDPNSNVFLGGPKNKKEKTPTSRSLKGTVTDDYGQPLDGALVTLTNKNTNDKWTFVTKKDGRYNFSDLSFSIDYEVVARFKDMRSEPRNLSQYDHSPNIVRILSVAPIGSEKKESTEPEAKK